MYDAGANKYWSAFDYRHYLLADTHADRSAVQVAGESLIVWSGSVVRRVALNGSTETVLFKSGRIQEMMTSPDGTKVALNLRGYAVIVLDSTTGERLLTVSTTQPLLANLGSRGLYLGDWRTDGSALSLTNAERSIWASHTVVAYLDGTIRALPEEVLVSPDLRYAIQFGEVIGIQNHHSIWTKLDIIDVDTDAVLWTIADEGGIVQSSPGDNSRFWIGGSKYVEFGTADSYGVQILDTETGEMQMLTEDITRQFKDRVHSNCEWSLRFYPCDIRHDGRVVWEGSTGWTQYLGVIDLESHLVLSDVNLLDVVHEPVPPDPPAREEMVGPLLVYEIHGPYEYRTTNDEVRVFSQRRIIAYDESTDSSWLVLDYSEGRSGAQVAKGGIVVPSYPTLFHITPDREIREPRVEIWGGFVVSPDRSKVVVKDYGSRKYHGGIIIFELPSWSEMMRISYEDIAEFLPAWNVFLWRNGWTSDSQGMLVLVGDTMEWAYGELTRHALVTLDGDVLLNFCDVTSLDDQPCLSPDARYIVRGRDAEATEYHAWNWDLIDIIDFQTGNVLWSLETAGSLQAHHWEWASPRQFAWSSGAHPNVFLFDVRRLSWNAEYAEVSVIDVETGEIEVMDSGEYLARFHPPSRATTDCPPNPAHACRILLDGEVVGEGRWPIIIGFIELDSPPPAP